MAKKLFGVFCVLVMAVGVALAAGEQGTVDVDVYVTPGVSVTLTAPTSYYNFGTIGVNTSSNSATAVVLRNDSSVSVALEKTIADKDAGGTVVLTNNAPSAINEFRIRCATSTTRVDLNAFDTVNSTFSITEGVYNNLTGPASSTQVTLAPSQQCNVWFQIDMPPSVDNSAERKFDITFRGTAQ